MVNAQPSGVVVSPRAAANLKRSLVLAIPCGLVSLLILALLGHPLGGLFVVIGLALGFVNVWLVQRTVVRFGENHSKSAFLRSVFGRLAGLTIVGVVSAYFIRPDGFGVLAGIALFQVLMLIGAMTPMMRELRQS